MQRQQQQHMMDSAQMHHMGMGMTHMGSNNNLYGMGGQIMAAAGGGGGGRMSGYASGLPQQQQQQQGGHSARGHSASHQYHASGGGGGLRGNSGAGGRGLEPSSAGRVAMGSFFMEEGFKVQMQQRRYLALARVSGSEDQTYASVGLLAIAGKSGDFKSSLRSCQMGTYMRTQNCLSPPALLLH